MLLKEIRCVAWDIESFEAGPGAVILAVGVGGTS